MCSCSLRSGFYRRAPTATSAKSKWDSKSSSAPPTCAAGNLPERLPPWRTVIGVIADMKDQAINLPSFPCVYAPYTQYHNEGWGTTAFAVRTTGDPLASTAMIRDQIHALLPNHPIFEVASMEQLLTKSLSRARFSMTLLSIFAQRRCAGALRRASQRASA